MSLDDFNDSLDSPLADRDALPSDLPNLRAAYGQALAESYRFCTRCWMPTAPVRRCVCAPEPYPEDATPARVLAEHPAIRILADAVASGRFADDTATREQRGLEFVAWLAVHGKYSGDDDRADVKPDAAADTPENAQ